MPFVQSAGARIYWKLEGRTGKPPLILLNSIGTDMDLWGAMLAELRRHFLLVRIDTRGHGASDAPDGDYRMAELAGDVAAVMDAAGIGAATIAGVSLGGMIAMQLALDAPRRVVGLALICTSATMDPVAWQARVDKVRAEGIEGIVDLAMSRFLSPEFAARHPAVAATVRQGLLATAPAGYAGCAAAIRDLAVRDRLAGIRQPTLIVTGTADMSTPYEGHGDHLAATIVGARHLALDTGHLAPLEIPDILATMLIDMFEV